MHEKLSLGRTGFDSVEISVGEIPSLSSERKTKLSGRELLDSFILKPHESLLNSREITASNQQIFNSFCYKSSERTRELDVESPVDGAEIPNLESRTNTTQKTPSFAAGSRQLCVFQERV